MYIALQGQTEFLHKSPSSLRIWVCRTLPTFTCCPIKQNCVYKTLPALVKVKAWKLRRKRCFISLFQEVPHVQQYLPILFCRWLHQMLLLSLYGFFLTLKTPVNLCISLNMLHALEHLNKHPMWGALDIRVFFHRCLITFPKVSDYSLLESQIMLFPISGILP